MANILIIDSIYENHFPHAEIEQSILPEHDVRLKHIARSADFADLPLESVDVLLLWACVPSVVVDRDILARLRQCRAIVKVSVGFENVDLAVARERGIDIFNVPDYGTEEVADHAFALLLTMARKIIQINSVTKQGDWDWKALKPVRRLRDKTLGIIGFGRIGGAVARRAQAFGLRVCVFDPFAPSGVEKSFGVVRHEELDVLLAEADYLSVHCALNDSSRHLLGREQFARMKRGVLVVNTARGGVIDSDALLDALDSGVVGLAGLDVIEGEPDIDSRYRQNDSVILTSHAAFYSEESLLEMRETSANMAKTLLSGKRPRNLLN
jgi:D-3-phosphoglycerate dehydrogenase/C-terminal binding protein